MTKGKVGMIDLVHWEKYYRRDKGGEGTNWSVKRAALRSPCSVLLWINMYRSLITHLYALSRERIVFNK